jgi:hypothetical protein
LPVSAAAARAALVRAGALLGEQRGILTTVDVLPCPDRR